MRAGFRVMENQAQILEKEERRKQELEKIPELNTKNDFAEIGNKKATDLGFAL